MEAVCADRNIMTIFSRDALYVGCDLDGCSSVRWTAVQERLSHAGPPPAGLSLMYSFEVGNLLEAPGSTLDTISNKRSIPAIITVMRPPLAGGVPRRGGAPALGFRGFHHKARRTSIDTLDLHRSGQETSVSMHVRMMRQDGSPKITLHWTICL